jgi:hypothetical protein
MGFYSKIKNVIFRYVDVTGWTLEQKLAWIENEVIALLAERSGYTIEEINQGLFTSNNNDLNLEADLNLNEYARGNLRKMIRKIVQTFNSDAEVTLKECENLKTVKATQLLTKLKAGLLEN